MTRQYEYMWSGCVALALTSFALLSKLLMAKPYDPLIRRVVGLI